MDEARVPSCVAVQSEFVRLLARKLPYLALIQAEIERQKAIQSYHGVHVRARPAAAGAVYR
jgi:hypothetical protein